MKMSFKQFNKLCSRHGLVAADGGSFWTAYRRWFPHALKIIRCNAGKAMDGAVYKALADLI